MGRTPHTPTRLRLWGVRPIRLRHAGYRCIRTDTPAFPSYIYNDDTPSSSIIDAPFGRYHPRLEGAVLITRGAEGTPG